MGRYIIRRILQAISLLFFQSLEIRNYPVLLAELLLGAVFVIAFNLIADILYAVMNPRIRYS
jgi:peptide/nickel transport system permease protein